MTDTVTSRPNRSVILAARPQGAVTPDCFAFRDGTTPELGHGDVLVRNIYLSCDPYMRGQLGGGGYKAAFALGEPIPSRVVGEVVESRNPPWPVGQLVWGFLDWSLYTRVAGAAGLRAVSPELGPISHAISVLGMPGLTAQIGMRICAPAPGECVYVSAASGAVGQVAGQLARLAGARVVGSAGSERKVRHLIDALGFDAAFDYRAGPGIDEQLGRHCPNGIDAYFDNVGGATLDAVLAHLKPGGRIAVCGQIAEYDGDVHPLKNIRAILGNRATMTGFSVRDHMHEFDAVIPRLATLMRDGRLRYREDIIQGIDALPAAFVGMMRGENLGKRLVQVHEDPTAA